MKYVVLSSNEFAQNYVDDMNYAGNILELNGIPADCGSIKIELSLKNFNNLFTIFANNIGIFGNYDVDIVSHQFPGIEHLFWEIFNEFDHMYELTQGYLSKFDAATLILIVLENMMENNKSSVKALEVGSWTGFSSYLLSRSINAFEMKDNKLFCIDTWGDIQGGVPKGRGNYTDFVDVLYIFRSLLKGKGVMNNVRSIASPSLEVLPMLNSDNFDFIFLDGDHDYKAVYPEILHSIDKLKVGGVLIGHDYFHYNKDDKSIPQDLLESRKNSKETYIDGLLYYTGVTLAVREVFGESFEKSPHSSVWYKTITQEDKERAKEMAKTLS